MYIYTQIKGSSLIKKNIHWLSEYLRTRWLFPSPDSWRGNAFMVYRARTLVCKLSKSSAFQTMPSRHSSCLPETSPKRILGQGLRKRPVIWGGGGVKGKTTERFWAALARYIAMPRYEACANAWKRLLSKRFLVSVTFSNVFLFLSFFCPPPSLWRRAGG